MPTLLKEKVINSITATGSSGVIDIGKYNKIALFFTAESLKNRSGALTVSLSMDGTNFVGCNMLIDNVTNTNAQNLTRIASKTRNTDGTDLLLLSPEICANYIKVTVTITSGESATGTFSVGIVATPQY